MSRRRAPIYAEIFSGCGGMSLGLKKAGWKGLFAIEKDSMAFETLKHNLIGKKTHFNWPKWLPIGPHDINEVLEVYEEHLKNLKGSVDLVAGGPPCQGFSCAGRRDENDHRNKLVDSYVEFIKLIEPRILFFENVKGFTHQFMKTAEEGKIYSDYVAGRLQSEGYNIKSRIIDFSEFGVPQSRKRFIMVGVRNGDPETFFVKLESNKKKFLRKKGLANGGISIWEAISDLEKNNGTIEASDQRRFEDGMYSKPKSAYQRLMRAGYEKELPDSHRFRNHLEDTINKFQYILENCTRNKDIDREVREKFNLKKRSVKPLASGKASPTLTTLPDDCIHYSEPRVLTVREYARIQSFDDSFEFMGKYTTGGNLRTKEVPRYSQVGNAIPPLFGEQSGIAIKGML